jgi:hypothetical protein
MSKKNITKVSSSSGFDSAFDDSSELIIDTPQGPSLPPATSSTSIVTSVNDVEVEDAYAAALYKKNFDKISKNPETIQKIAKEEDERKGDEDALKSHKRSREVEEQNTTVSKKTKKGNSEEVSVTQEELFETVLKGYIELFKSSSERFSSLHSLKSKLSNFNYNWIYSLGVIGKILDHCNLKVKSEGFNYRVLNECNKHAKSICIISDLSPEFQSIFRIFHQTIENEKKI